MRTLQLRCNVCNKTGPHIALGLRREQDKSGWEFQRVQCGNCGAHIRIDSKAVNYFEDVVEVADVMTVEVRSLTVDDSLQDAARLFQDAGIHHAPVFDPRNNEVCGIVSDRDLLRAVPPNPATAPVGGTGRSSVSASVSSIMTREVSHVRQTASLADAIRLMRTQCVDCLLVYDDPAHLEGILTSRDCLKTVLAYLRACVPKNATAEEGLRLVDMVLGLSMDELFQRGVRTVADVMSRSVFTLTIEHTVQAAIALMQARRIRHIPIVNEHKHLLGIVSDRDVLAALTSPLADREATKRGRFRARLFATTATEPTLAQSLGSIMTENPIAISPAHSFQDAIAVLVDKGFSCLPIVDVEQRVCGIFTSADVLTATLGPLRFCHRPHITSTGRELRASSISETGTGESPSIDG